MTLLAILARDDWNLLGLCKLSQSHLCGWDLLLRYNCAWCSAWSLTGSHKKAQHVIKQTGILTIVRLHFTTLIISLVRIIFGGTRWNNFLLLLLPLIWAHLSNRLARITHRYQLHNVGLVNRDFIPIFLTLFFDDFISTVKYQLWVFGTPLWLHFCIRLVWLCYVDLANARLHWAWNDWILWWFLRPWR